MKNKLIVALTICLTVIIIAAIFPLLFKKNSISDDIKAQTLSDLSNTLELYYFDNNEYPETLDQLTVYNDKHSRYINTVPFIANPKNPEVNSISYQPTPSIKPYSGYNLSIELKNKKYPGSQKGILTIKNKQ